MSTAQTQRALLLHRRLLLQRPAPRCLHAHSIPPTARIPAPSSSRLLPRRIFSTTPRPRQDPPPAAAAASQAPPGSSPPPPRWPKPRFFSAALFLLVGAIAGTALRVVIAPPPPLVRGSVPDEALKADIRALAEKLPIVRQLMAEPGWTHHEAYSVFPAPSLPDRLTTGPLSSSQGIGAYQHIFHPPPPPTGPTSPQPQPITAVLHLGLATTGWPGVVHGGLLSTILDEHSARAALAEVGAQGGGGGGGVLTARLEVAFVRPTLAGGFYVVKARALGEGELEVAERGKRERKIWVDVWLETLEGVECVRGRALFVRPRGRSLRGLEKGF